MNAVGLPMLYHLLLTADVGKKLLASRLSLSK